MNQSLKEDEKKWPMDLTAAWAGIVDWMFCYEEKSVCVCVSVGVWVHMWVCVCVWVIRGGGDVK